MIIKRGHRTPLVVLFALTLVINVVGHLIVFIPRASAEVTGTWLDAANIQFRNETYTDNKLFDSMDYSLGGDGGCANVIKGFNKNYGESGTNYESAELHTKNRDPRTGDCPTISVEPIRLLSTDNARMLFRWVDSGRIETVMQLEGSALFNRLDNTDEFLHDISVGCKSGVVLEDINNGRFTLRLPLNGCSQTEMGSFKIGDPRNASLPPGTGTPTTPIGSTDDTAEDNTCQSGAGVTGWIICVILELAGGALNFLDSMVVGMLNVDESYITNPGTEEIWKRFRNIAYLILVPIFLVMVISTALGFEFISAYTVKKALPRLVFATVFIALSFEISKFLIILTNDIGGGMLGLMSSASGDQINNLADLFEPGWFSGAGLLGLMGIGAAGVTIAAGVGVFAGAVSALIGFLGAAAIAVLLVLLLLGFRQVLIIALAILSPLAILSWIFPGNDKLWKLWKDSFAKLLLLFPVIMLTLGAGRMFASIVGDVTVTDGPNSTSIVESTLNTIIKLCAYVLPYFLIPFLFKSAGGLFANIAGMTNNRQKGWMDRSRNWGKHRRETSAAYQAVQTRKGLQEKSRAFRGRSRAIDAALEGGRAARGIDTRLLDTARAERNKEEFSAASQTLTRETVSANRPRSAGSHVIPAGATPEQEAQLVSQMGTLQFLRYTAVNDQDDYRRQAAIAQLVQQQDVSGLDYVRQQARARSRDTTLPEGERNAIRNSFNQQVPDNYGALKAMSPDLAKEVSAGQTEADAALAAMADFENVSVEHQASMKPDAWRKWRALDPVAAEAAYNAVLADPQASAKLAGEVHSIF